MQNSINQMTTIVNTIPLNVFRQRSLHTSNLYFHIVLRANEDLANDENSARIRKYICGFVKAMDGKVQAISIAQNRLHILVGLEKTKAPANFVSQLKLVSKTFARRKCGLEKFFWCEEYETFTVSLSQIERVKNYIRRQPQMSGQESYASSWQRYRM